MQHYNHIDLHYHKNYYPQSDGRYTSKLYVMGDYNQHEHRHESNLYPNLFKPNHHLVVHHHYHEHFWVPGAKKNYDYNTYINSIQYHSRSRHRQISTQHSNLEIEYPEETSDSQEWGVYTCRIHKLLDQFNNSYSLVEKNLDFEERNYISYHLKHFKINIFQKFWKLYRSLTDHNLKLEMRETLIPQFTNINWTTMSRLYDPQDLEFLDLFKHKLNQEFSQRYNPLV